MNTIIATVPASVMVGLIGDKILNFLNKFARISEGGNFNGGISLLIVLWLCVVTPLICYKGKIPKELKFYMKLVLFAAFMQRLLLRFPTGHELLSIFRFRF